MDHKKLVLVIALPFFLVSCGARSGSPGPDEVLSVRETSERIIRSDMAEIIDVGEIDPVCHEVVNPLPGTTFQCSAQTSDARIMYFSGQIMNSGHIVLETTNVLIPDDLPPIEQAGAAFVEAKIQEPVPVNAFDCGAESIILNANKVIRCGFDDGTGTIFESRIKITSIENTTVEVEIDLEPNGNA